MEPGIKRPVAIGLGVAVVLGITGVALLLLSSRKPDALPSNLTTVSDPAAIKFLVDLSHLGILTSTNFLGHRIYTVTATLKNTSDKSFRRIDAKLTFFDYNKKMIHEEVRTAFDVNHAPFAPGSEHHLEIAFENPPSNWNYHVPDTELVMVAY
ncbi:MAG TPA: hypothetical protein VFD22_00615 [Gemmatimonadaceae bacterium]|jgi:hypothetical protein|nr:hypothetical protein [Gemmatimonadaceae bacterium]